MIKGIEIIAVLVFSAAAGIAGFFVAGTVLDPVDVDWTYCSGAANGWEASYVNYRKWVVGRAPELSDSMPIPSQETLEDNFEACLKGTESYLKYIEDNLTGAEIAPYPRRVAKE